LSASQFQEPAGAGSSIGTGGQPAIHSRKPQNGSPIPIRELQYHAVLTSQSATRLAGVHVMGTELKEVIDDDASWIGRISETAS